jgi:hypothetical protein
LEIGSYFLPRQAWTMVLLVYASCHCWNDRHTAPRLGWDGILKTFCWAGLEPFFSQFQPPK